MSEMGHEKFSSKPFIKASGLKTLWLAIALTLWGCNSTKNISNANLEEVNHIKYTYTDKKIRSELLHKHTANIGAFINRKNSRESVDWHLDFVSIYTDYVWFKTILESEFESKKAKKNAESEIRYLVNFVSMWLITHEYWIEESYEHDLFGKISVLLWEIWIEINYYYDETYYWVWDKLFFEKSYNNEILAPEPWEEITIYWERFDWWVTSMKPLDWIKDNLELENAEDDKESFIYQLRFIKQTKWVVWMTKPFAYIKVTKEIDGIISKMKKNNLLYEKLLEQEMLKKWYLEKNLKRVWY